MYTKADNVTESTEQYVILLLFGSPENNNRAYDFLLPEEYLR